MELVKITKREKELIESFKEDFKMNFYGMSYNKFVSALKDGFEVIQEYSLGEFVVYLQDGRVYEIYQIPCVGKVHLKNGGKTKIANVPAGEIRHATPYEIAKEKERRLFASVGRETWHLKEGDILYDKQNGFSSVVDKVAAFEDGVTVIFKDKNWAFYNNVKEEYTVACFVENRLDVKTNE